MLVGITNMAHHSDIRVGQLMSFDTTYSSNMVTKMNQDSLTPIIIIDACWQ